MQPEIAAIQRELQALRREVRRQRRRAWLVPLVVLLALVPLAAVAATPFNDLNPGSPHNGNIDAIYNAHVTTGCVPNQQYCPNGNVTREEMASFLARLGGLGGNPPVANAATVSGWPANALVRTGATGSTNLIPINGAGQVLTSINVAVPAPGLVFAVGQVTLSAGTNGFGSTVQVAIFDPTANFISYPLATNLGFSGGYSNSEAVSPTTVFSVASAGTRTFALTAVQTSGAGNPAGLNPILSVLYVPFGLGGGQAGESTDNGGSGLPNQPAVPTH